MKAVSISWVTQPKDRSRRHCYNVCWINDLGTSHIEATAKQVCASALQHLKSQTDLLAKAERTKQMKLSYFEKVSTIADGWCGWHSMLAARDVQRYLKVPRNVSIYPINSRLLKQESNAAKELCASVCDCARGVCQPSHHPSISRVESSGYFAPTDLEWIAEALATTVRCTCCIQARDTQIEHPQYLYIYI